ncbi:hypothetical protein Q7C36_005196 [Tachysurus vachellii]|uniref:Uncharacterized protein n=1 Tax=Tachysurus vachellii TaxID=175792 RepID=A0AA88T2D9_TACVA|nr:hypothetical protein Q7C36_005196 [Tachysurus vachellii]
MTLGTQASLLFADTLSAATNPMDQSTLNLREPESKRPMRTPMTVEEEDEEEELEPQPSTSTQPARQGRGRARGSAEFWISRRTQQTWEESATGNGNATGNGLNNIAPEDTRVNLEGTESSENAPLGDAGPNVYWTAQ